MFGVWVCGLGFCSILKGILFENKHAGNDNLDGNEARIRVFRAPGLWSKAFRCSDVALGGYIGPSASETRLLTCASPICSKQPEVSTVCRL